MVSVASEILETNKGRKNRKSAEQMYRRVERIISGEVYREGNWIVASPIIAIQLGRLTPMPELPRSGRMNLGRRFNANAIKLTVNRWE